MTPLKRPDTKNESSQRSGEYVRVIFIWRVVNSNVSAIEQFSTEAVKACGTKKIGMPAALIAFVTVKSSDRVPLHLSRIRR